MNPSPLGSKDYGQKYLNNLKVEEDSIHKLSGANTLTKIEESNPLRNKGPLNITKLTRQFDLC